MEIINLFVCGSHIKAWHGEAYTLSDILGIQVINPDWAYGVLYECSFPNYMYKENFEKLISNGYIINLWHGKVKNHILIGIFYDLEDVQYLKYNNYSFSKSTNKVIDKNEFDVTIIQYNIVNGFQSEAVKKHCLKILEIFEKELRFLRVTGNIEEYWKMKKEIIKPFAEASKNATKIIADLDSTLMYGNIDLQFEIFRKRLLEAREFSNFENSNNLVKFYNKLFYGIEKDVEKKETNLIARMLFCSIINNEYDEMLRIIFSAPKKFYNCV